MDSLLKRLCKSRRLSYAAVARRAVPPTTAQQIQRLAEGERALNLEWGRRLEAALDVAPQDLVEGRLTRVRLELAIAAAYSEARPDSFNLPPPARRWIEAPGLERPEECFAARIEDDSSDRLYPQGSLLFARRREFLGPTLTLGEKIIVRCFAGAGDRRASEVLSGRLGQSPTGDLVLFTYSSNRQVPSSVSIQPAPSAAGLSERLSRFRPHSDVVLYQAGGEDPAEIVGAIEFAWTRERLARD